MAWMAAPGTDFDRVIERVITRFSAASKCGGRRKCSNGIVY
jgi:hypothetical protein